MVVIVHVHFSYLTVTAFVSLPLELVLNIVFKVQMHVLLMYLAVYK